MSNKPTIALIGYHGQVARELQRSLALLGNVVTLARATADRHIDLANPDSLRAAFNNWSPDIIINAAAYTAVDKAETDESIAMAINGIAPGILAEIAKQKNALLVHYSTDYVFDGKKSTAYTETDPPAPLNVYGKTKLAGEQAVSAMAKQHFILRTSWVYGLRGSNFLKTILRVSAEREELKIVDDQIGAPTWSRMLALATTMLVTKYLDDREEVGAKSGLYHLSAGGQTSWYGFSKEILQRCHRLDRLSLKAIPTEEYPLPATRPKYSVLANTKLESALGIFMPPWQQALALCMQELV
jgi:dTDP-4-dehydrorhamnose reductase